MKSRLLVRLDADIRGASSPSRADRLRCERAVYLACHGKPDEARRELLSVRERHETRQPRPALYIWLNLAEGLISQSSQPPVRVRDKLARAHALSCAADQRALRALSAAWLAQLDLSLRQDAAAARLAVEALNLAGDKDLAARARAALVLAQCFDVAGRNDLARPWYAQAHHCATTEGDDTVLSSTLWHMACWRVAAWRQALACEAPEAASAAHAEPGRHALASAESAALYDRLSGVGVRQSLQPILRAQVHALGSEPEVARALYEQHLETALLQGLGESEGVLRADLAWCRLATGQREEARSEAKLAAAALEHPGAHGDRAPGHSRLAEVLVGLGEPRMASAQQAMADARWAGHRQDQEDMLRHVQQALGHSGRASAAHITLL